MTTPQNPQLLLDIPTNEARFRLTSLLVRTPLFDIALGEDTHLDNKQVCLKAIRYNDPLDQAEVQQRRADLERELEALTLPSHLLPEPLDWLQIENARDFAAQSPFARTEPLLVYEYQAGKPLSEVVTPEGFEPHRALAFTRELALFLQSIHEGGYVFRDLSPEHIIVGLDDMIHIVGCGNICKLKTLPSPFRKTADRPFIAPELRDPSDPNLFNPAADIYTLGVLLGFMLTGQDPLKIPECPLSALAFHRIGQLDPGVGQLIARMIDVNPARRFASVGDLLQHLQPNALPNPAHPDFRDAQLPSPWRLDEAESPAFAPLPTPGPLVVRDPQPSETPKSQTEPKDPNPTTAPTTAPPIISQSPQAQPENLPVPASQKPNQDLVKKDDPRRTALMVRAVVGGTILIIFSILMAALKWKGYF